jgi:hypothetical protein
VLDVGTKERRDILAVVLGQHLCQVEGGEVESSQAAEQLGHNLQVYVQAALGAAVKVRNRIEQRV